MTDQIDVILGAMVGREHPGGCATCAAYRIVEPDPPVPGCWRVTIHHADNCPTYLSIKEEYDQSR